MSAPALVLSSREEWLAARRNGIGASDVAAILGVDPRRGPLAVYTEKVGAGDPVTETKLMRRGRRLQSVIAEEYAEETGREVGDLGEFTITPHPTLPFVFSTLDRTVKVAERASGPAPLELKAVWAGREHLWDTEPPVEFQVQLQAQMACLGAEWGSLACLIGGLKLWWTDAERNDRFLAAMTTALEAFWERVERRQPPAPDATEGTLRAIRSLYPKDKGTTIALAPELYQAAERIDTLRAEISRLEDEKAAAEALVKLALEDNTWGTLSDGSRMQWRVEHRDEHIVHASDPRVLRRVGRPKGWQKEKK